jgi:3-deoxy-D-arabino-heptulosonate 7-phosphate (DAHP) synthase
MDEAGCGLLDALVGWSVSKQYILKYEEHLKGGKYLLMTHGSKEEVMRAQKILQGTGSLEGTHHSEASAQPTDENEKTFFKRTCHFCRTSMHSFCSIAFSFPNIQKYIKQKRSL